MDLKHDSESELWRSASGSAVHALGRVWGEAAISKSLVEDTRNEQIPTTSRREELLVFPLYWVE